MAGKWIRLLFHMLLIGAALPLFIAGPVLLAGTLVLAAVGCAVFGLLRDKPLVRRAGTASCCAISAGLSVFGAAAYRPDPAFLAVFHGLSLPLMVFSASAVSALGLAACLAVECLREREDHRSS